MHLRPTLAAVICGLVLSSAGGADAPPLPAPDAPVVLETFRVDTSKDRGYLATNATTGTRLNMAIKDIPLPIEVITREFIADIGAQDIKEALQFSAGIVQETVTTGNNFTFSPSGSGNAGSVSRDSVNFTVRGLNTRSYLRSGFRQDSVTDIVNLDRVEVARGPQALLYGVAALGGVVNITPRYPRAAGVGSEARRGQLRLPSRRGLHHARPLSQRRWREAAQLRRRPRRPGAEPRGGTR